MEQFEPKGDNGIRRDLHPRSGEEPEERFARIIVQGYLDQHARGTLTDEVLMKRLGSWYIGAIQSENPHDPEMVANALRNGGVLDRVNAFVVHSYKRLIEDGDNEEVIYHTLAEWYAFVRQIGPEDKSNALDLLIDDKLIVPVIKVFWENYREFDNKYNNTI